MKLAGDEYLDVTWTVVKLL